MIKEFHCFFSEGTDDGFGKLASAVAATVTYSQFLNSTVTTGDDDISYRKSVILKGLTLLLKTHCFTLLLN